MWIDYLTKELKRFPFRPQLRKIDKCFAVIANNLVYLHATSTKKGNKYLVEITNNVVDK